MKELVNCIYCGHAPIGEWDEDFGVECSNPTRCKGWVRIYAYTRNRAVESWNKAMRKVK